MMGKCWSAKSTANLIFRVESNFLRQPNIFIFAKMETRYTLLLNAKCSGQHNTKGRVADVSAVESWCWLFSQNSWLAEQRTT